MANNIITLRESIKHEMFTDKFTLCDDNLEMEFKDRLRRAREDKKLTQAELTKICGWVSSPSRISMYERGEREPNITNLKKLSDVLGVSIEWLIRGDKEEKYDLSLDKETIMAAKLLNQLPNKKKKAILTLCDADDGEELGVGKEPPKSTPPVKGKRRANAQRNDDLLRKERRSGRDRRQNDDTQNVINPDFRSGLDRRQDGAAGYDDDNPPQGSEKGKENLDRNQEDK